ncbi:relaxase/mobilization nuclease domain-containing protein [Accumulibacter sp.]|uniref:relaxase/mobilization nuclease domain-containing protein n=1 Tax=Accumulibacter sp. TaxID=2053492 RepID=UPI0025847413|nr:relaxase/mobilization nuclease domain-containing protein [Accumulibacter sp.]
MVPRTTKGRSFKGAAAYYLHDKGKDTDERVVHTEVGNIPVSDPDKAINWMCYTAMHADTLKEAAGIGKGGRKLRDPVYSFSLSWHPDERPDGPHMVAAAKDALRSLQLGEHQYLLVIHNDTKHPHIHAIVNRVHPETGKAATLSKDQLVLSEWAETYEREHGIYCAQRLENNEKRREGGFVKDREGQARDQSAAFNARADGLDEMRAERDKDIAADAKREAEAYRAEPLVFPDDVVRAEVDRQQAQELAQAQALRIDRERVFLRQVAIEREALAARFERLEDGLATRQAIAERLQDARMLESYGDPIARYERRITELDSMLAAGGVRGMVGKALGRQQAWEAERQACLDSVANAQWRQREAKEVFRGQQEAEREALRQDSARARRDLDRQHDRAARALGLRRVSEIEADHAARAPFEPDPGAVPVPRLEIEPRPEPAVPADETSEGAETRKLREKWERVLDAMQARHASRPGVEKGGDRGPGTDGPDDGKDRGRDRGGRDVFGWLLVTALVLAALTEPRVVHAAHQQSKAWSQSKLRRRQSRRKERRGRGRRSRGPRISR